jgi:hypothetical protein
MRAQYLPFVHPLLSGAFGVEGRVRRQSDGGLLSAKARDRVI